MVQLELCNIFWDTYINNSKLKSYRIKQITQSLVCNEYQRNGIFLPNSSKNIIFDTKFSKFILIETKTKRFSKSFLIVKHQISPLLAVCKLDHLTYWNIFYTFQIGTRTLVSLWKDVKHWLLQETICLRIATKYETIFNKRRKPWHSSKKNKMQKFLVFIFLFSFLKIWLYTIVSWNQAW